MVLITGILLVVEVPEMQHRTCSTRVWSIGLLPTVHTRSKATPLTKEDTRLVTTTSIGKQPATAVKRIMQDKATTRRDKHPHKAMEPSMVLSRLRLI